MSRIMLSTLAATAILASAGCAARMPRSGFLQDYSRLEPVPLDHPGWDYIDPTGEDRGRLGVKIWMYRDRAIDVGAYDRIYIDDPAVLLQNVDRRISQKELTAFTRFIKDALIESLADRYPLSDEPGPGVMRFRAAVTRLEPAYHYATPDLDAHPLKRWANSLPGAATLELEILDGASGEQIAAIILHGNGSAFDTMRDEDPWTDPRRAVRRLFEFLRLKIDEAHDADGAEAAS